MYFAHHLILQEGLFSTKGKKEEFLFTKEKDGCLDKITKHIRSSVFCFPWVRGLMVAIVGFQIRDLSLTLIMCQITDDGLRQVVFIVP